MNTEPDGDVTPALGAALAGPTPDAKSLYDLYRAAGGGTDHYQAEMFAELMGRRLAYTQAAVAEAVAAEKERIAQVAEDVGAHYHDGAGGQSASFADLLRGARS